MKLPSGKISSRSSCLDRSLECAAMEWNGEACTLGERAFTRYQVIDVWCSAAFCSKRIRGMLCSMCRLQKRLASAWKIYGRSTEKLNKRLHQLLPPPFYCSPCGNISFSFNHFYMLRPARQRARNANGSLIYSLKSQVYKGNTMLLRFTSFLTTLSFLYKLAPSIITILSI